MLKKKSCPGGLGQATSLKLGLLICEWGWRLPHFADEEAEALGGSTNRPGLTGGTEGVSIRIPAEPL